MTRFLVLVILAALVSGGCGEEKKPTTPTAQPNPAWDKQTNKKGAKPGPGIN